MIYEFHDPELGWCDSSFLSDTDPELVKRTSDTWGKAYRLVDSEGNVVWEYHPASKGAVVYSPKVSPETSELRGRTT